MLTSAGIDRVLTMDLHADQIQGFFNVPVDNIYATPVLLVDIERRVDAGAYGDVMIVSPDVGGVVRARAIAKQLNASDLAIIDKRRFRYQFAAGVCGPMGVGRARRARRA